MKRLNTYTFYLLGLLTVASPILLSTLYATQKEPISNMIRSLKKGLNKVKQTGTSIKDKIKSTITNSDFILVNDTDYDVYFTLRFNTHQARLIQLRKHSKERYVPRDLSGCLETVESMIILPINLGSNVKYEPLIQTVTTMTDSKCIANNNDYDIKVTQNKTVKEETPGGGLTKTTSITFTLSVQDRHNQHRIEKDTTKPQKILYEIVEMGF